MGHVGRTARKRLRTSKRTAGSTPAVVSPPCASGDAGASLPSSSVHQLDRERVMFAEQLEIERVAFKLAETVHRDALLDSRLDRVFEVDFRIPALRVVAGQELEQLDRVLPVFRRPGHRATT